jgi:hypothetical protein
MLALRMWSLVAAVGLLAGCAGEMQGVVRGTGQPVQFAYEQGVSSDSYTAEIDGELFQGRAVMDGATSTFGTGFGTAFGGGNIVNASTQVFAQTTTGNISATLLGNRGSTLQCAMRYADSSGLTTSGGIGQCSHSDGRIIDVVW